MKSPLMERLSSLSDLIIPNGVLCYPTELLFEKAKKAILYGQERVSKLGPKTHLIVMKITPSECRVKS